MLFLYFFGEIGFFHLRADDSISILTLGDSLTWGYSPTGDTAGGYRDPLYTLLTNDGKQVNYVGVGNGNSSTLLTDDGETANDGFNGYTINQIDENLTGNVQPSGGTDNLGGDWLSQPGQQANLVLLMAGTNDITLSNSSLTVDQVATDITTELQGLISDVRADEPNATILVASPPDVILFTRWVAISSQLNLDIQSMVATDFAGQDIDYVDMFDDLNHYGYYAGEDGVHLNESGYTAMGNVWYNAILEDYNFDADPPAVPEPSTCALLLGGGLMLYAWRRMKKLS